MILPQYGIFFLFIGFLDARPANIDPPELTVESASTSLKRHVDVESAPAATPELSESKPEATGEVHATNTYTDARGSSSAGSASGHAADIQDGKDVPRGLIIPFDQFSGDEKIAPPSAPGANVDSSVQASDSTLKTKSEPDQAAAARSLARISGFAETDDITPLMFPLRFKNNGEVQRQPGFGPFGGARKDSPFHQQQPIASPKAEPQPDGELAGLFKFLESIQDPFAGNLPRLMVPPTVKPAIVKPPTTTTAIKMPVPGAPLNTTPAEQTPGTSTTVQLMQKLLAVQYEIKKLVGQMVKSHNNIYESIQRIENRVSDRAEPNEQFNGPLPLEYRGY